MDGRAVTLFSHFALANDRVSRRSPTPRHRLSGLSPSPTIFFYFLERRVYEAEKKSQGEKTASPERGKERDEKKKGGRGRERRKKGRKQT